MRSKVVFLFFLNFNHYFLYRKNYSIRYIEQTDASEDLDQFYKQFAKLLFEKYLEDKNKKKEIKENR
ncbi:hypothetical protein BOH71_15845 [Bacillus subtilis]|nr:hypothetical protein BOH71_15845 [Bacillus subtilis]